MGKEERAEEDDEKEKKSKDSGRVLRLTAQQAQQPTHTRLSVLPLPMRLHPAHSFLRGLKQQRRKHKFITAPTHNEPTGMKLRTRGVTNQARATVWN